MPFLAAALCAAVLSLLSPAKLEAGQYAAVANAISASQAHSATLVDVGYYGGGDYYGDDQGADDYDDRPKRNYGGYRHYRKHYQDHSDGCCNNGCYKKKWVCEESEPRCRKARECVWYYGKEYCRDVRRCNGGGDRYCKWVSYRSNYCGQ